MVTLHTVFLVCMPLEVLFAPTKPVKSVALLMILLALISQGLRWWCIRSLGFNWNPKVIVVPGLKRVQRGPYRWMNHPNYVAVAVEGIALPMVHFCWRTAVGFTLGNAILMVVRIRCENNALRHLEGHES
jgi:methyltransferase